MNQYVRLCVRAHHITAILVCACRVYASQPHASLVNISVHVIEEYTVRHGKDDANRSSAVDFTDALSTYISINNIKIFFVMEIIF